MNPNGEFEVDENGNYLIERTNVITEKRILDKIEKIYKDGIKESSVKFKRLFNKLSNWRFCWQRVG